MKFRVRVKELKKAMEPIFAVATTNGIKDYENAGRVTFIAEKEKIVSIIDNGRVQLIGEVNLDTYPDLQYEFIEGGSITIRAKELEEVIGSFGDGDTVEAEIISSNSSDDDESKELRFSNSSDLEVYQSLQTLPGSVGFPKIVMDEMEASDPFTINRGIYAMASKRLTFANGYEDFRPEYKYWIIRADKDELRFAAGSGGRFAVIDYEGTGLTNVTKGKKNVLIPGEQSAMLLKVVSKIQDETIDLYTLSGHLVIKTDDFIMSMPQYEPNTSWPDENKFLTRDNSYKMVTRLGDWPAIVKGVLATCNDEFRKSNDYHLAIMTFNTDKKEILVEADGRTMKSRRKAKISDIDGPMPNDLIIRMESNYIAEAFKSSADDDYCQWEFSGGDNKVVVLRFFASPEVGDPKEFARINTATGIKERYSIFIGTQNENF